MPKVSIVLGLYNSERDVEECIKSLQNQSFKDYELIILEDCSTDKTKDILKQMNISFSQNKENLGFAKNVNQGIMLAKGEYIMIADHDMVYEQDYLKRMMEEGKDIMAGRMFYYKEKNLIRSFGIKINMLTGKTIIIGRDKIDKGQFDSLQEIPAAAGGTLMIKKSVFDKLSLLDEDFFKYYVDVDFCIRAQKVGFKIYLSKAKCWHKKEKKEYFDKEYKKKYYEDKKRFLKLHSNYYPFSILPAKLKGALS